ncbi:uncharacterized protein LOC131156364 isoform X2 [Malania oleifera]|uniref:uncharacterized protein LOC131156364 isoform X2 n=1 Tax=Malania oleifera TaxID=397392 RepID=UPI0025AEC727|nr:uncharacterized protein LOC131156364 isoform X2 [Malania oleifera]
MCIAAFIWQDHPLYPLLLFLNRDEYYNRPTKPLAWWEDGGEIVGGRDEIAGGTWLACSRDGRLALVTNVREIPFLSEPRSRGDLPRRFLQSNKNPVEFAAEVVQEADQYNGFNLVLADLCSKTMIYLTNRPREENISATEVSPGIHVLSNASLDTPWPKALRLHKSLKEQLEIHGERDEVPMKEMVEKLMMDTVKDEEESLRPGIYPPRREYLLSSIFVEADTPSGRYGTRSTSALSVKGNGDVCFYERSLEKGAWEERTVDFHIQKNMGVEAHPHSH